MKSEFEKWFIRQHGPIPTKRTPAELSKAYQQGIDALNELTELQKYRAMKNSALYAWQASRNKL